MALTPPINTIPDFMGGFLPGPLPNIPPVPIQELTQETIFEYGSQLGQLFAENDIASGSGFLPPEMPWHLQGGQPWPAAPVSNPPAAPVSNLPAAPVSDLQAALNPSAVANPPQVPTGPGQQLPAGDQNFWNQVNNVLRRIGETAHDVFQRFTGWLQQIIDWLKAANTAIQWTATAVASAFCGVLGGYLSKYLVKWSLQLCGGSLGLVGMRWGAVGEAYAELFNWFASQAGAAASGAFAGFTLGSTLPAVGSILGAVVGGLTGVVAFNIVSCGGNLRDYENLQSLCLQCFGCGLNIGPSSALALTREDAKDGAFTVAGVGTLWAIPTVYSVNGITGAATLASGFGPVGFAVAAGAVVVVGLGSMIARRFATDQTCGACGGTGRLG